MLATHRKSTHSLIVRQVGGHVYMLRFELRHPLAACDVLERWLRDGLIRPAEFGFAIGCIAQLALGKEGAAWAK